MTEIARGASRASGKSGVPASTLAAFAFKNSSKLERWAALFKAFASMVFSSRFGPQHALCVGAKRAQQVLGVARPDRAGWSRASARAEG